VTETVTIASSLSALCKYIEILILTAVEETLDCKEVYHQKPYGYQI